jgi:hypothetical protein
VIAVRGNPNKSLLLLFFRKEESFFLLACLVSALCGLGDLRRPEEVAGDAGGVEGQVQGFADSQKNVAAGAAVIRVFGEFGIDVGFDDVLAGGDFAFLAGEIDAFPKIAQDEGAPGVFPAESPLSTN